MSLLLKNMLETLALMGAVGSVSQWPSWSLWSLQLPVAEPTAGMLVLCGFLVGFFIVQQRLKAFRSPE